MRIKKEKLIKVALVCLVSGFVLGNLVAYRHVYAMTHFVAGGERTKRAEELNAMDKVRALVKGVNVPRPGTARTPTDAGLTFDEVTIQLPHGEHLAGWHIPCKGAQSLVVLFHGYASGKSTILYEAALLHRQGYATFLVDFRGSGGSSGDTTSIGYREAEDVAATVAYVEQQLAYHDTVLYGQSMGAAAILCAVHNGGIAPDAIILEAVFDRLVSTIRNRFKLMHLPSFPGAELLVFWGGMLFDYNGFRHNPVDYAEVVTCPVLVLHGACDPRADLEGAEAVYEKLSCSRRMVVFQDIAHEAYAVAAPEKWSQEIGSFLRSSDAL